MRYLGFGFGYPGNWTYRGAGDFWLFNGQRAKSRSERTELTPETAWIGLLIVDPRQRRVGYGRALHAAIVDRASSWPGVRRILLGIVATNAAYAEPFSRAVGYRPTGEVRPYRYDHVESTVARWELAYGIDSR